MKQVSILGCGWLGLPLAAALIENKFVVKGTTTTQDKLILLAKTGVSPYLITIDENKINGDFSQFLKDSNILIINIPPKLRGKTKKNFVAKIKNIIPLISQSTIENVLFVSSTSVYADDDKLLEITENSVPKPNTESGKQLLEVENLLLKNENFKTTIVRFGGLIGPNRNPIKSLAGRENLENPDGPVNLIHQEDCINIILKIIESNSWNTIYNAVAPFHPTREEYYNQKALEFTLPQPTFDTTKPSIGKVISSAKIIIDLDYQFVHKI